MKDGPYKRNPLYDVISKKYIDIIVLHYKVYTTHHVLRMPTSKDESLIKVKEILFVVLLNSGYIFILLIDLIYLTTD